MSMKLGNRELLFKSRDYRILIFIYWFLFILAIQFNISIAETVFILLTKIGDSNKYRADAAVVRIKGMSWE